MDFEAISLDLAIESFWWVVNLDFSLEVIFI